MDLLRDFREHQLSEYELIIFLLVDGGISQADIARALGVNRSTISRTLTQASRKLDKLGNIFVSSVEQH